MPKRSIERSGPEAARPGREGTGHFQATRSGAGFIRPEEAGAEDLFVSPGEQGGALHGDRVRYLRLGPGRRGRSPEAAVVEILGRAVEHFTGVLHGSPRHGVIVPDHPRLPPRLRLVGDRQGLAEDQRLLCRLHESPGGGGLGARVVRILGDADDARLDEAMVTAEFGLPGSYPEEAIAEATETAARLSARLAGARRRDFGAEVTLTIDPADARDRDDGVTLRRRRDGGWLLRVHIADVAEAVALDGPCDREARVRGTSVYFPGGMIPMLPLELAAGAMSLGARERRPVLTVSLWLTTEGRVRGAHLCEGWIVSDAALAYEQVQAVLDGRGSLGRRYDRLLREMDDLAQRVRRRRFARGAWDLEIPETRVRLDARGRPVTLERRLSQRSHQLIEEFMILANRAACSFARRLGHPYLYRVHPPPDPLALEDFRDHAGVLEPRLRSARFDALPELRRWLAALPRGPRRWQIHELLLRAIQRARYSPQDQGHSGLGVRGYGHFTSPIRRYPDLYNHRIVKWALHHGRQPVPECWRALAGELGEACTGAEVRAEQAERALVRIKCLRWAEEHLGAIYRGRIVSVSRNGYRVQLDPVPVDGFVPRSEAHTAHPPPERQRRAGARRGDLQIGDPVLVQLARVDMRQRTLYLAIRAAGRRARTLDPQRLEPLADPWGPAARAGRKGRRNSRRPYRRRHRR